MKHNSDIFKAKAYNELIGTIEEPISTEQAKELGVVIELDEINIDNQ